MNQDEQLLHDLVAIPSLSGQEAAAVAFLVGALAARGWRSHVDEAGNAVGVRECPAADGAIEQEILLLGHIDTVPGTIPVTLRDGKLYGRGSVDAKGSLATFVAAGSQVALQPGQRLVVVGAVEEEAATSKGARQVARDYRPDFCLIGEPSGADALTLGYKGRVLLDYRLRQPVGHSAGPLTGAPEIGVRFWQQIQTFADNFNVGRDKLFDQLLPSLRQIQSSSDGLTAEVVLTIGLRLPPDFQIAPFLAQARRFAEPAALTAYAYEPAYAGDRQNQLVRAFAAAWREQGLRPRYKLKTGTADMNVVAQVWDCPIVAYGPGDSQLDHTPEEHLPLAEYHAAIQQLVRVLSRLRA